MAKVHVQTQLQRVTSVVKSGRWYTLREIANKTQDPEASVSARLRDLRSQGWTIKLNRAADGVYSYRAIAPKFSLITS